MIVAMKSSLKRSSADLEVVSSISVQRRASSFYDKRFVAMRAGVASCAIVVRTAQTVRASKNKGTHCHAKIFIV